MNIALDCERLKYPNTGLYQFCTEYAEALGQIASPEDSLAYYVTDDNRLRNGLATCRRYGPMDKLLRRHATGVDIYHALQQLSPYRIGDRKTRMVLTVHDLNFLYEKQSGAKIRRYLKHHQRIIDRADSIVAISEYTKQDILRYLDTGGKPLTVIHNGCRVSEFGDYDSPVYRPSGGFIFAMGAVVSKKNFHTLPALLVGNDYELVIAGNKSAYLTRIESMAKQLGVTQRVKITGPVSMQDKYWYLKNCIAFAFPSIAEGSGLPPVEAMRFGKPVFLSTHTSLPEIGGDAAYYFADFEPENMREVFERGMSDYSKGQGRSESIKKYSDGFSWTNAARQYYDVYLKILG